MVFNQLAPTSGSKGCRFGYVACILFFIACCTTSSAAAGESPRGLWLLPRKDACNTARSDVSGDMKSAPREVWSYGSAEEVYSCLLPVRVGGKDAYFTQVRSGLQLVRPDGKVVWKRGAMGVSAVVDTWDSSGKGKPVALVTLGTLSLAMIDVTTGSTLWTWQCPEGSFIGGYQLLKEKSGVRLIVFPQNSMLGLCFQFSSNQGKPKLLWQKDFTGKFWQGYGPYFVLADMDNDSRQEIVLISKPGYAGVIDTDTGQVKFDLKYEIKDDIGRPYGLIHASDIDGDGYRDVVVVSCQVELYISVLHNNAGKSLSVAWSQFVGKDFPVESVELRPNATSVVDVNGDGKKELVLGLFNGTGDGKWHTLVFDTMKGFDSRLADIPGRYFWGCYDLDGDGRPEIITSKEDSQKFEAPKGLQIVDGRSFSDITALDKTSPVINQLKLRSDTAFVANRRIPTCLAGSDGKNALLVTRGGSEYLVQLKDGKPVFQPFVLSPVSRSVMLSQGDGKIPKKDLKIHKKVSGSSLAASAPLVAASNGRRELILSLSNGTIIGGTPDLKSSGRFKGPWTVRGSMASVWIGPDGERVLSTADPKVDVISLYSPGAGEKLAKPISSFSTPMKLIRPTVSRSTSDLLPFGEKEMRLFVGFHPGAHTVGSAVYDRQGKQLWIDRENGPYPRVAAASDINADGKCEVVVDNHGTHLIYDEEGRMRTVAVGWSDQVPGRGNGGKYTFPIIGAFGPGGETRIVMSGGLDALETLDAEGNRLGIQPFESCYIFQWSGAAVAKIRGAGEWDVAMADGDGVLHLSDLNTCRLRWTLDLGVKATSPINVSVCDIDGDGRDNLLVGLPNGELLAIDEKDGKGFVMWKKTFPAEVNDAYMADVDGDGTGEILAELGDGSVKILKADRRSKK